MPNLSDKDRQALQLADHLRLAMTQWLSHREGDQFCAVSPFVDPAGQPAVIIRMNARAACAMMDSLNQQRPGASQAAVPQPRR